MSNMRRSAIILPFIALAVSGPRGLAEPRQSMPEVVDRIVAVVGDQVITLNELDQAYQNDYTGMIGPGPLVPETRQTRMMSRSEYLEKMVEQLLIEQEVDRQGISVDALEIEKAIERQKQKLGLSDEQFQALLKREGITMDQYRKKVQQDLVTIRVLGREVRSAVEISDEEMKSYYRQYQERFIQPDQVDLSHLSLALPDQADEAQKARVQTMMAELRARILRGEDFADIARECSRSGISSQGGDLGWFKIDELKPGFARMIQSLEAGQISQAFQLDQAFHLLRVNEWKKGQEIPFEEVKEQIREILYQKEVSEKYQQWLERLKARSHVEIRL
jgi:peptidyl-prolyl cis-trans isomerase SurA